MGTCLVFGAGASLANAQHFESEDETRNPPLDTSFFEKIRDLEIAVSSDLRGYSNQLPTGSPFDASVAGVRMEEFFKDLFFDFSKTQTGTEVAGAYTDLVGVYRRVISRTTDWMTADKWKGGPVGELIAWAVAAADSVALLTFNQDLVLENEIYKRPELREHWCLRHGYGQFGDHLHVLRSKKSSPMFDGHDDSSCDGGLRLSLLKLHGSLNWQVRMNGRQPSPKILSGQAEAPQVQLTRRRRVPAQLRYTPKSRGRGRSTWYMWPVIIPPIYNKQMLIERFIPQVWEDARTALDECDRLVFFGYSLPPTDIEAEKLFQRAIFQNDALPAIDVINPDPGSASRFARLVPAKSLHWYPDAAAFMASMG